MCSNGCRTGIQSLGDRADGESLEASNVVPESGPDFQPLTGAQLERMLRS